MLDMPIIGILIVPNQQIGNNYLTDLIGILFGEKCQSSL